MSARHTFAAFNTTVGSPSQKLILLKLADNANDDGISWPGIGYICKHCELSRSSVIRHLKELEERGYFTVVRRKTDDGKRNKSNVYKLNLTHRIEDDGSVTETLGWCHHDTRGSVTMTPESTNIESTNEPTSQSVGSTPPLIDEPEPKPNRLDTRENARALAELWNQVIDEHNPNWRKVSTPEVLSAKRERTAKKAINFAKARYKLKHNGAVPTWPELLDWFTRYLEAAAHHEFHSGYHVSAQYPQGFRRDFDLQLRQSTMEKFVDENNEG